MVNVGLSMVNLIKFYYSMVMFYECSWNTTFFWGLKGVNANLIGSDMGVDGMLKIGHHRGDVRGIRWRNAPVFRLGTQVAR